MNPANLADLLTETARRFPGKKALLFKDNDRYLSYTWGEVSDKVTAVASALLAQGAKPGDRLALLSENRPEWLILDLAAQMLGVATVPIYPSLTPAEIQYILADSGAAFVGVSNKTLFEKLTPALVALPALRVVIGFDASLSVSGADIRIPLLLMRDLERDISRGDRGGDSPQKAGTVPVDAAAVASIIYTSGTTGKPKGVMLTHANFLHNVLASRQALKMGETDLHLSFLPLCHVFERMAGHYLMVHIGATIAYAESLESVPKNLIEVRPTFVLGVPRFYEKIRDRVLEALKSAGPLKKGLFFWAKELGERKRELELKNKKADLAFRLKLGLANILVYRKFAHRLGGRVRFCVSGGAPLPKEIAEFFDDLGVKIYEGYGLTETSPVISVNREAQCKFGTVGIPLDGAEVRIGDDGEILTRGASVMKGYYGKPEETAAVLDKDGWFHTGDLGRLDKDGFLSITGRKKELIVTSGGKKISPRPIEETLEKDEYLLRCVLFGDGRHFITAFLVPRKEKLLEYADQNKIAYTSYADLLRNAKIYQFIEARVERLTADLANFEKIKYFTLLESDFTQASGELTPTLKVKREVVQSRYKDLLLPFYDREREKQ